MVVPGSAGLVAEENGCELGIVQRAVVIEIIVFEQIQKVLEMVK